MAMVLLTRSLSRLTTCTSSGRLRVGACRLSTRTTRKSRSRLVTKSRSPARRTAHTSRPSSGPIKKARRDPYGWLGSSSTAPSGAGHRVRASSSVETSHSRSRVTDARRARRAGVRSIGDPRPASLGLHRWNVDDLRQPRRWRGAHGSGDPALLAVPLVILHRRWRSGIWFCPQSRVRLSRASYSAGPIASSPLLTKATSP